jgi:hypothetical protein
MEYDKDKVDEMVLALPFPRGQSEVAALVCSEISVFPTLRNRTGGFVEPFAVLR